MSFLVRHPDTPPGAIQAIDAELARVPGGAVVTLWVLFSIWVTITTLFAMNPDLAWPERPDPSRTSRD